MGKIILIGVVAAIAVAVVGLIVKIIAGAIGLIGSLFNMILGLAVIVALIVIVVWMFRYAKKH